MSSEDSVSQDSSDSQVSSNEYKDAMDAKGDKNAMDYKAPTPPDYKLKSQYWSYTHIWSKATKPHALPTGFRYHAIMHCVTDDDDTELVKGFVWFKQQMAKSKLCRMYPWANWTKHSAVMRDNWMNTIMDPNDAILVREYGRPARYTPIEDISIRTAIKADMSYPQLK